MNILGFVIFFECFLPLLMFPRLCFFSADPAVVSFRNYSLIYFLEWIFCCFVFFSNFFLKLDGVVVFSVFLTGFDHTRRAFKV